MVKAPSVSVFGCTSMFFFSDCKTLVEVINGPSDPGFSGEVKVKKGGLLVLLMYVISPES